MIKDTSRHRVARCIVLSIACLSAAGHATAQPSEKEQCFNFDALTPELRAKSEAYLLHALDTEPLFTLASGLKPMSGGFFNASVRPVAHSRRTSEEASAVVNKLGRKRGSSLREDERAALASAQEIVKDAAAWKEIEELREILPTWKCGGEVYADVVHYAVTHDGERQLQGVIFSVPSLRRLLAEKRQFFSRWALTPNASPLEVVLAVEYSRDVSRFAGYGYLFGYPDEAVQFFATASASQDATGVFVKRDFRAIPTFEKDSGQFTYAVEKGIADTAEDIDLRTIAAEVLKDYRARRVAYIGPGKPGVVALVRDWFCPQEDQCRPSQVPK